MRKLLLSTAVVVLAVLVPGAPGTGVPPGIEERERPNGGPRRCAVASAEEPVFPAAVATIREGIPRPDLPDAEMPPGNRLRALVSEERMLADLERLTRIGAEGLFRTSGTSGEREAFEWLAGRVGELRWLAALGATVERPRFRVPLASEVRRAEVSVTIGGVDRDVAAHALQGHRDVLSLAQRFDSDGAANDARPDPVTVEGPVRVVRHLSEVAGLPAGALRGRVVVADYALLAPSPAALLLVTRFSNVRGEAHGSFVGDVSALASVSSVPPVPTLHVKLEDLATAGIDELGELERISRARVTWDADVVAPGESQLLVLRVPGEDPSRAVVVGAHLDSPNSPGALDDGSGSVALLEAARVLDAAGVRPPVDTVLVWFGSHERGLYGSSAFANANAALLGRSVAMVQLDCLTHPLDGMTGGLVSEGASYRAFGDARVPLPAALSSLSTRAGVSLAPVEISGIVSDNSSFEGFDVPSANTILLSPEMAEVHVDGHLHDPYDDLPLARLHGDDLVDFAAVALTAVLELPKGPPLRLTPEKTARAVFVASRTEAVHMTPAHFGAFGQALAWEGWAVDVVPYGTPVTAEALAGAGLVVVLPVVDYPPPGGVAPYDERFSTEEVAAIAAYARNGGLLVLAGSAALLRYGTTMSAENEDWNDVNDVAGELGLTFAGVTLPGRTASVTASHPLVAGVGTLTLVESNGFSVRAAGGTVLARAGAEPAAVLVPAGSGGEVLALGDVGILGGRGAAPNLPFLRSLARYARDRAAR